MMEIKENVFLDELIEIFDENNQNYVADKKCIKDSGFLKVVATENGLVLGYAVVYFGVDFMDKEGFPTSQKFGVNSAYIWHCITRKSMENKGVQSAIYKYILDKFNDYDVYSVVDTLNIPSVKLHDKFQFEKIEGFEKVFSGKLCTFNLLKRSKKYR